MVTKPSGQEIKRPSVVAVHHRFVFPHISLMLVKQGHAPPNRNWWLKSHPSIYLQLGMVNPCGSCVNSIYICVCVSIWICMFYTHLSIYIYLSLSHILHIIYYIILHSIIYIYIALLTFFPRKIGTFNWPPGAPTSAPAAFCRTTGWRSSSAACN